MKKSITIIIASLIVCGGFLPKRVDAQAPEKLSYQAVIRDANGDLVADQTVGMRISIMPELSGSLDYYSEIQTPTTNSNGLVSIEIGGNDAFSEIDWTDGPYYIKTETDPEGGTDYTIEGISQLLSVPYALHAKNADSLAGNVTTIDYGFKKLTTEMGEYVSLFPITPDSCGSYTIMARAHSVALGDRYQEWRLILNHNGGLIQAELVNIGDLAGCSAIISTNHGIVYGRWSGMVSDDNFTCYFLWRHENFKIDSSIE